MSYKKTFDSQIEVPGLSVGVYFEGFDFMVVQNLADAA